MTDTPPPHRTPFEHIIHPGTLDQGKPVHIFCKIEFDGRALAISGVEGPTRNGNCAGSCGQISGGYAHRNPADNDPRTHSPTKPDKIKFAAGWNEELWLTFLDLWKRWHLNDMRVACEHQRKLGWTYDTHRGQECPECGYQIGTEWKFEEVPAEVLDVLRDLPPAGRTPAWV